MCQVDVIIQPDTQNIIVTTIIHASPQRVFDAFMDKAKFEQWWAASGNTVRVEKLEARTGGQWRYVNVDDAGNERPFFGVFHEVTRPERIIQTTEYQGAPHKVAIESVSFTPLDNNPQCTIVRTVSTFQTYKSKELTVQHGLEEGIRLSYKNLDAMLSGNLAGI